MSCSVSKLFIMVAVSLLLLPSLVSAGYYPVTYWRDDLDDLLVQTRWDGNWNFHPESTHSGDLGYVYTYKHQMYCPGFCNPNYGSTSYRLNYTVNTFSGLGSWAMEYEINCGVCSCWTIGTYWTYPNPLTASLRLFDGEVVGDCVAGTLTTPVGSCSGAGSKSGKHICEILFDEVNDVAYLRRDGGYVCAASIPSDYNPTGWFQFEVRSSCCKQGYPGVDYVEQWVYWTEWGYGEHGGTTTTIYEPGNFTVPDVNLNWISSLCCAKGCYFVPLVCYFLATFITLSFALLAGVLSKDSLFGIGTALLFIVMFSAISFYPVWAGIVAVVIFGFLAFGRLRGVV